MLVWGAYVPLWTCGSHQTHFSQTLNLLYRTNHITASEHTLYQCTCWQCNAVSGKGWSLGLPGDVCGCARTTRVHIHRHSGYTSHLEQCNCMWSTTESMAYFLYMFDVCGCGTVDIHSSALGDSDDQHHLFHLNDEITIHFLLRFHWRESGGDYWVTRSVARPWKSIICLPLLWPILENFQTKHSLTLFHEVFQFDATSKAL